MANSISGNAGTAGATVVLIGYSPATASTVTADGSGNYTFSGLNAGSYFITPSATGFTFAPYVSKQTIVASNITGVNFTATAFTPTGVWSKQGGINLIPPVHTSGFLAGTQGVVLYNVGTAQILSGAVFKAWYMDGPDLYYAESLTGLTGSWTKHVGAILSSKSWVTIYYNPSNATYYLFCTNAASTAIQVYTASDGITFTQQNAAAIVPGSAGSWDASNVFQLQVVDFVGGVWRGLYTGDTGVAGNAVLGVGLATSPDLITWTKVGTDPVIFNGSAPSNVVKVGSTYYTWVGYTPFVQGIGGGADQYTFPTDIGRMQSTDLITWTNLIPSLPRTLLSEGAGIIPGQTNYASVLDVNGNTYMFYMGTNNGPGDSGATNFQMLLATAPMTTAALVGTNEGVLTSPQLAIDTLQRANENPLSAGGKWTTIPISGFGSLQLVSHLAEPTATSTWGLDAYTGISWPNDQYSEFTLKAKDNNGFLVIYVRSGAGSSGQNGYVLQFAAGAGALGTSQSVPLYRITNGGVGATLATLTVTPRVNDIWRISVSGSTISIYQNGLFIQSVTDSTYAAGSPAIQGYNSAAIAGSQIAGWAGGSSAIIPLPPFAGGSVIANDNASLPTPSLTRGRVAKLGTITTNQVVQFSLAQEIHTPNGLECLTIVTVGGTITAGLEASLDGVTWFGVLPRAASGTAPNYNLTTLNGDTAASSANSYDVSSLQAGALFRFGGATAPAVVWVLFS